MESGSRGAAFGHPSKLILPAPAEDIKEPGVRRMFMSLLSGKPIALFQQQPLTAHPLAFNIDPLFNSLETPATRKAH